MRGLTVFIQIKFEENRNIQRRVKNIKYVFGKTMSDFIKNMQFLLTM